MSIAIKQVTHIYSPDTPFQKTALKNINLHIAKGKFVGIIGHTGSGKSTLIQMFNGLIKPTQGSIYLDGVDIHQSGCDKKEIRQKVGLVFQYPEYQLFEQTIYDDVAYGPKNQGFEGNQLKERIETSLRLVGIDESLYQKSPFELSGGQKRRVAIAGVLAMRPQVLVLDEPTAGLDPKGREELFGQLRRMHEQLNLTIILISHSMEDVAKYVEELIVLHRGEVAYEGTPREVFAHGAKLEEIGLAVPQICYITEALKQRGIAINSNVLTTEEAAHELDMYFKQKEADSRC
ncbi:MAG: energy-coupling factor transporter ATPase [Cellulosilyticaceae bacterium]